MCNFSQITKSIVRYEKNNEKLDDEIYHLLYDNFLPLFTTYNNGATHEFKEWIEEDAILVEIELRNYICNSNVSISITKYDRPNGSTISEELNDYTYLEKAFEQVMTKKHLEVAKINAERKSLVEYLKGLI